MRIICIFSFFLNFLDKFLIRKKLSFLLLHKSKNFLYKKLFKNSHKNLGNILLAKSDIIVSLTVIESRIHFLKFTLNSLIAQTYKVKKIIVNYDDSIEYKYIKNLIEIYDKLGVEFRLVENFGSHKKYLFLNKDERKYKVLLCDDDMIYDKWFIESLKKISNFEPNSAITLFGRKMCDNNNNILQRKLWPWELKCCKHSNLYYWCGNAFTLYPNNFFDEKILNKKLISKLFFNSEYKVISYDDSWLNFNRLKKNIKVFYARPYSILYWPAPKIDGVSKIKLGYVSRNSDPYWSEENVFKRLLKENLSINC